MNAGASLDSSAAMVRAESDQLDATLHALVRRLSSVPGLMMTVSHRHGRLRRLIGDLPYINDLNRWSDFSGSGTGASRRTSHAAQLLRNTA